MCAVNSQSDPWPTMEEGESERDSLIEQQRKEDIETLRIQDEVREGFLEEVLESQ